MNKPAPATLADGSKDALTNRLGSILSAPELLQSSVGDRRVAPFLRIGWFVFFLVLLFSQSQSALAKRKTASFKRSPAAAWRTEGSVTVRERRSALWGEVLGRGLITSLNFDYEVVNGVALGVGAALGLGFGGTAYSNFYLTGERTRLMLTAGATLQQVIRIGADGMGDYDIYLAPGIGLEHRSQGGFLFRLTGYALGIVHPQCTLDCKPRVLPWVGVGFGGAF